MSAPPPPPPPRHHARLKETKSTTASSSTVAKIDGEKKTWRDSFKSKGSTWGKKGFEKSITWSDSIGGKVNTVAEKVSFYFFLSPLQSLILDAYLPCYQSIED